MREEFYDIYREMDAEYYRQQLRGPRFSKDASLAVVDEALSEALEESPVRVRPDAVHFLRVNLHQMVAEPLFRSAERLGAGEVRLHPKELKEDLKHDAQTVLLAAARISDDGEVTGHQLVNALSRSWDLLRTTAFDIWG